MSQDFLETLKKNNHLKHITIGTSNADLNIEQLPFFKVAGEMYQKFDVVWHDQDAFGNQLNWRSILDEMIRLLGKEGRIVVAIEANKDNKVCCNYQRILANVKMYLFRRLGLKCEVEYENPLIYKLHAKSQSLKNKDRIITVFKIERKNIEIYNEKLWTFALLTNGDRVEHAVKFCASIRKLDPDFTHEILICGPQNDVYQEFNVSYIDHLKYRHDYAEICSKKNDLTLVAKNQNLLIAHDRFYLGNDFFEGFKKYGYDFDFLTVKNFDEKGNKSTCWYSLKRNIFDADILKFGDFFDASSAPDINSPEIAAKYDLGHSFLSGGCMIFKKDILLKIGFNELIFWQQVEDIEISKQFIEHGLLPKMNCFSSVITSRMIESENVVFVHKTFLRKIRRSLAKKFFKIGLWVNDN